MRHRTARCRVRLARPGPAPVSCRANAPASTRKPRDRDAARPGAWRGGRRDARGRGAVRAPPPGSEKHLYLIDLSGYVFRAYHAIAPLSSSKGEPTHAVLGTVNMLQKVVNERRPHMLAVAMDSKGKTFRHELDARYKAHRPAAAARPRPADGALRGDRPRLQHPRLPA